MIKKKRGRQNKMLFCRGPRKISGRTRRLPKRTRTQRPTKYDGRSALFIRRRVRRDHQSPRRGRRVTTPPLHTLPCSQFTRRRRRVHACPPMESSPARDVPESALSALRDMLASSLQSGTGGYDDDDDVTRRVPPPRPARRPQVLVTFGRCTAAGTATTASAATSVGPINNNNDQFSY